MSELTRITSTRPESPDTDRETRAAAVLLGVIIAVAAALRFWNLGGGLPSLLGTDEPQIMVRSLTMVKTGDFHPHFFDYPGFYLYLQAAVVAARFLAGASTGAWSSLAQVSDYDFYLWGRAVTATFGTATVYLVYLAGRRWGVRHGLVAAAALAVLPIHVRESHFVLTDVPMTFFVTLALVLALRAIEERSPSAFVWAGAAAGLAAGTKYTAWVSILMPLLAAAFVGLPFTVRVRRALATLAGFLAAFLVVAPYTVLDLPGFLDGFGALAAAVPKRPSYAEAGWLIYLKHLRLAVGWPGMVLTAAGLGLFGWRLVIGPGRARFAMVLVFLAVFWSMLIDRQLIFARYLMPALPFVSLLLGVVVIEAVDWIGRRPRATMLARVALVLLVAGALAQPAISSVRFGSQMGRRTTESLAIEWIGQNAKPGARIIHEHASLHFPANRYRLEYVRSLTERDVSFYLGGNVDYIIASSASYGRAFGDPRRFAEEYLAYRNLFDRMTAVFTVQSSPDRPGPEIRIFTVPR